MHSLISWGIYCDSVPLFLWRITIFTTFGLLGINIYIEKKTTINEILVTKFCIQYIVTSLILSVLFFKLYLYNSFQMYYKENCCTQRG